MDLKDNQCAEPETRKFTHIGADGQVRMVDVTGKADTVRTAVASGKIYMNRETLRQIMDNKVKKGNVLETARIAGIMGAKRTAELIPLCHPLAVTFMEVNFFPDEPAGFIRIESVVRLSGKTGVEMEALTAVSVAALTIYDMCKSYDRSMILSEIGLMEKTGGKSGHFQRKP